MRSALCALLWCLPLTKTRASTPPEGHRVTCDTTPRARFCRFSCPANSAAPSPMFAVSPWRRFPRQVVLAPLSSGASLISSWVPAPPERTECRNAWQAPALFWNLLRSGCELAPRNSGACTIYLRNLPRLSREPATDCAGACSRVQKTARWSAGRFRWKVSETYFTRWP